MSETPGDKIARERRITRLNRRCEYLDRKIKAAGETGKVHEYEIAELSALRWVIHTVEEQRLRIIDLEDFLATQHSVSEELARQTPVIGPWRKLKDLDEGSLFQTRGGLLAIVTSPHAVASYGPLEGVESLRCFIVGTGHETKMLKQAEVRPITINIPV